MYFSTMFYSSRHIYSSFLGFLSWAFSTSMKTTCSSYCFSRNIFIDCRNQRWSKYEANLLLGYMQHISQCTVEDSFQDYYGVGHHLYSSIISIVLCISFIYEQVNRDKRTFSLAQKLLLGRILSHTDPTAINTEFMRQQTLLIGSYIPPLKSC